MPKLTILGSGTCFITKTNTRRGYPGFFLRWGPGDAHILFDASPGIAERLLDMLGMKPHDLRNLAISHAHPDHFALPHFLQAALCSQIIEDGFDRDDTASYPILNLFAPKHILDHLDILNRIHFEGTAEDDKAGLPFPIVKPVPADGSKCSLPESAVLSSFNVKHDFGKCDAVAFRVVLPEGKIFVYSGDTGVCEGIEQAAQSTDVFVCEASARVGENDKSKNYGHLTPFLAGQIAKKAGVRHLVLTHHPGFDSDEAMIDDCRKSGFDGKLTIATDGLEIEI